jgi:hypothetical protein
LKYGKPGGYNFFMHPEKEKKIKEKLQEEDREALMMTGLMREQAYALFFGKGFLECEIEIDPCLTISDGKRTEDCAVDFILKPEGKPFAAVICTPAALESSERHILAWGRVKGVALCISTNGLSARILKAASGELIGEKLLDLPERNQAIAILRDCASESCPPERLEKEKRILLAFNVARCSFKDICPGPGLE